MGGKWRKLYENNKDDHSHYKIMGSKVPPAWSRETTLGAAFTALGIGISLVFITGYGPLCTGDKGDFCITTNDDVSYDV